MKKWLLGLLLGGLLGILDGLTAPLSVSMTTKQLLGIVVGSCFKGLLTGILIGYFSQRIHSLKAGLIFGIIMGAFWAFVIALMQYLNENQNNFLHIMLTGSVLGVIVGYATQKYGTPAAKAS
jgi:ABC-type Mn2+/Zn2+ transport system permease subunit